MLTQVDPLAGARDRHQQRIDELVLLSDDRKDGAVVVDVGVDVEQLRRKLREVLD